MSAPSLSLLLAAHAFNERFAVDPDLDTQTAAVALGGSLGAWVRALDTEKLSRLQASSGAVGVRFGSLWDIVLARSRAPPSAEASRVGRQLSPVESGLSSAAVDSAALDERQPHGRLASGETDGDSVGGDSCDVTMLIAASLHALRVADTQTGQRCSQTGSGCDSVSDCSDSEGDDSH